MTRVSTNGPWLWLALTLAALWFGALVYTDLQVAPPIPQDPALTHAHTTRHLDSLFASHYGIEPRLAGAIRVAAAHHAIPLEVAFALVSYESGFNPRALSPAGARGLTQVMPSTGLSECHLPARKLYDVEASLDCGFSYLASLHSDLHSWDLSLIAYNRGPVRALAENYERRGYATHVLTIASATL